MRAAELTPDARRRLLATFAASAITSVVIYTIAIRLVLPALEARVTRAQVEWLRRAFEQHPLMVLGAIVVLAAVLALPVLGVFRWVYGPLHLERRSRAR
jgi:hypothetical protein